MRYMAARKMGMPKTRFRTMWSILSEIVLLSCERFCNGVLGQPMDEAVSALRDDHIGFVPEFLLDHLPLPRCHFRCPGACLFCGIGVALKELYREPLGIDVLYPYRLSHDGRESGDRLLDLNGIDHLDRGNGLFMGGLVYDALQGIHPFSCGGHDGNNRAPEPLGKALDVDGDPLFLRHIHHVEGDDHGHPHLEELTR